MAEGTKGSVEDFSLGKDFLISRPINRNASPMEDHMFFFQMENSFSQVLEQSPLACLLKCWKDINPDNFHKKALVFSCAQAWLQYPLGDEKSGLQVECLTMTQSSSYTCFARWRANGQRYSMYSCSFFLKEHPQ
jgi:hypothetical protein